ncbi:MAG: type II toxin-antitoxin system Phd/YefM family antitoxin [Treponema sp.]|uniref:type II toxin-antitoxin system Phd/YefM family antitoxin n=1 Tax=Treponema sp. TaxID=166 RepID=UPI001B52D060|nr:type II toxin-antitoxin system Phd/YefM family antitoxin [Treponema sp.]MBP3771961.1 type II toxin-antitoxin system Phd/YefM family antitoxin [Treponema sp.]MBQ9282510.1 type II toxin-antitoxin system Phd/YefM family antitoxin [Treponema sp.]
MTIAKQVDLRANIKKFFDLAFSGEPVIVPRKQNKNVVIISEADFNAMEKARRNAAYLAKLDRADEQIRTGKIVVKTMEELETMAAE